MITQHLPLILVTLALGISLLMLQRQVASLRDQMETVILSAKRSPIAVEDTPPPNVATMATTEQPSSSAPRRSILKKTAAVEKNSTQE